MNSYLSPSAPTTSSTSLGSFPQAKQKTRNLPTFDYLEVLQTEFIVAQLRKKIYPHKKDKAYYERTMEHKKTKIEDIASRNGLPTMFTDTQVKEALTSRVINAVGFPNFNYKDEEQRAELEIKDLQNYYAADSEVKVIVDGKVQVGILSNASLGSETAYVLLRGKETPDVFNLSEVTRIL